MRRSRIEITMDILRTCSTTTSKSLMRLTYGVRINSSLAKELIRTLVHNGLLIEERERMPKSHGGRLLSNDPIKYTRVRYRLTKKGMHTIQQFNALQKLILELQKGKG